MVAIWKVGKGVKARLVDVRTEHQTDFVAPADIFFGRGDAVFTPTTVYQETMHTEIVNEYGFRYGETDEDRQNQVLVVQALDLELLDD